MDKKLNTKGPSNKQIDSVEKAIENFKKGEMVIIVDDEGFIKINESKIITDELGEFIAQYKEKKCLYHNDRTSKYFKSRNET